MGGALLKREMMEEESGAEDSPSLPFFLAVFLLFLQRERFLLGLFLSGDSSSAIAGP